MTRDEILNMEAGREMDALIAVKIFDWHWVTGILAFGHPCLISPERYAERQEYFTDTNNHGHYIGAYPYYSTDISAAWGVVEKMIEMGYDIVDIWHENDTGFHWFMEWIKDTKSGYANATTAPLAICRAALLAVMEEK